MARLPPEVQLPVLQDDYKDQLYLRELIMQGRDKKGRFAGKVAEDPKKCIRDAVDKFNKQCEKQNVVVVFARKAESQEHGKSDLPVEKRKVPEIPKNPDCRTATRGYAKHIGRVIFSNLDHHHVSPGWFMLTLLSGAFALSSILAIVYALYFHRTDFETAVILLPVSGCMFVSGLVEMTGFKKMVWTDKEIPRSLNDWEPPRQPKPRC